MLQQVGKGGMGRVYLAYDPQLDRKVALKVMRVVGDPVARQRLLREARAMARVSHPNVVAVHDAGEDGEQVFVAMDVIEGTTLGRWVRKSAPTRPQILEAFRRAGRGLQAAHAAGLVHRDFKPANVLLGAGGRVCVTDFGLAREAGDAAGVEPTEGAAAPRPQPGALEPLTQAGLAAGTPEYMAPEQWRLLPVDARTDQFAFCVALWEALYGARPFDAPDLAELARKVCRGELTQPQNRRGVPGHIHRALERGLAVRPEARFPDMAALLHAIARDTGRGQRWARAGAVLAAVLAVAAAVGLRLSGARARACEEELGRFRLLWNADQRTAVRTAFLRALPRGGEETWLSLEPRFDVWVADWEDAHRRACGGAARGLFPDEGLRRRLACLDERRQEGQALLGALTRMDRAAALAANEALLSLESPGRCLGADARAPAATAAGARARALVIEAAVANTTVAWREAEQKGLEAVAEAERAGAADELLRAWLQVSAARAVASRLEAADEAALEALLVAERSQDARGAAAAWVERMQVAVTGSAQWARAREYARHAEVALARAGGDPLLEPRLLALRGTAALQTGEPATAVDLLQRAVAGQEKTLGKEHLFLVRNLTALANAHRAAGQLADALATVERVAALHARALPEGHPYRAATLNTKGRVLLAQGDVAGALAAHRQALAIIERTVDPPNLELARTHAVLGECLRAGGEPAQAAWEFQAALEQARALVDPEHPLRATLERDLGLAALQAHDGPTAVAALEAALAGPWSADERRALQAQLDAARPKPQRPARKRTSKR